MMVEVASTQSCSGGPIAPSIVLACSTSQRCGGVRVLRDPFTAKPTVLFTTTKRVGGGVQDFDAIKVMKFAAA